MSLSFCRQAISSQDIPPRVHKNYILTVAAGRSAPGSNRRGLLSAAIREELKLDEITIQHPIIPMFSCNPAGQNVVDLNSHEDNKP